MLSKSSKIQVRSDMVLSINTPPRSLHGAGEMAKQFRDLARPATHKLPLIF